MKVVIDTSVLLYLVDPHTPAPLDGNSGKPVQHCKERIEGLIETLDQSATVLIVPTPVLSELLICASSRQTELLNVLTGKRGVQVASFDEIAAVENAQLRRTKRLNTKHRGETKKEVSFDLQILAIARAAQADLVLSDDDNLRKRCLQSGMEVMGIAELALTDSKRQMQLLAEESDARTVDDAGDEDAPEA